jgi:uncharacterized membrane protein
MNAILHSSWLSACLSLFVNSGTSYVMHDVHDVLHDIFDFKIIKWFVIFSICFANTRDVYISLNVSLLFCLMIWHVLNKKSLFYIKGNKTMNHFVNRQKQRILTLQKFQFNSITKLIIKKCLFLKSLNP